MAHQNLTHQHANRSLTIPVAAGNRFSMIRSLTGKSTRSVNHASGLALILSVSLSTGCGGVGGGGGGGSPGPVLDENGTGGSIENPGPDEIPGLSLHWDEPRFTVAGTCVSELLGYEINLGLSSGIYTKLLAITSDAIQCSDSGVSTSCGNIYSCSYNLARDNLAQGSWYIAIQVYDKQGNRSALSNEIVRTIEVETGIPAGLN